MPSLAGFAGNVSIIRWISVALLMFVVFSTFPQMRHCIGVDSGLLRRCTDTFTNIKNAIMYMVSFKTARIIDVWGS
jgi:hypothetical protein